MSANHAMKKPNYRKLFSFWSFSLGNWKPNQKQNQKPSINIKPISETGRILQRPELPQKAAYNKTINIWPLQIRPEKINAGQKGCKG